MNKQYNCQADFWARKNPNSQSDFLCKPHVLDMISSVDGREMVDLGCGEGHVTRILTETFQKVVGVDNSHQLITKARQWEEKSSTGAEYYFGDVTDLQCLFTDRSFDSAISINVAPHLNHMDLISHFEETYRILRPGGVFVFAAPHPQIYRDKPKTKWISFNYRKDKFDQYAQMPVTLRTGDGQIFHVSSYAHSEDIFREGLRYFGFDIQFVEYPKATEDDLKNFPQMWGKEAEVPFYVVYRCKKGKR